MTKTTSFAFEISRYGEVFITRFIGKSVNEERVARTNFTGTDLEKIRATVKALNEGHTFQSLGLIEIKRKAQTMMLEFPPIQEPTPTPAKPTTPTTQPTKKPKKKKATVSMPKSTSVINTRTKSRAIVGGKIEGTNRAIIVPDVEMIIKHQEDKNAPSNFVPAKYTHPTTKYEAKPPKVQEPRIERNKTGLINVETLRPKDYHKNIFSGGSDNACCVCGKQITKRLPKWLRLDIDLLIIPPCGAINEDEDLGFFVLDNDCAKRIAKEFVSDNNQNH
jgi:hypothetical protein